MKKILLLAVLLTGCSWAVTEQELLDAQKVCAANNGVRVLVGKSSGTTVICKNGGTFFVTHGG